MWWRKAGIARVVVGAGDPNPLVAGRGKLDSLIVEGGSELAWSALEAGVVDKVQAYIAPKFFGGAQSKTPVGGSGFSEPDEAPCLEDVTITRLGSDLLVEGRIAGRGGHAGQSHELAMPAEGGER